MFSVQERGTIMKKLLFILPSLLLVIYIIFTVIDNSDYVVEKKIWKVQHKINVIAQEGRAAQASQVETLARKTQALITQYPRSGLLPEMYMQLAQIYVFSKDFDKARTNYTLILDKFPERQIVCAKALMAIGATYLAQNRGDDAIGFYQIFVKEHPDSQLDGGLNNAIAYLQGVKKKQKQSP